MVIVESKITYGAILYRLIDMCRWTLSNIHAIWIIQSSPKNILLLRLIMAFIIVVFLTILIIIDTMSRKQYVLALAMITWISINLMHKFNSLIMVNDIVIILQFILTINS